MNLRILATGLVLLYGSSLAAGLIPIEDFARPAKFTHVSLSPDGKTCGYVREVDGRDVLLFADTASWKVDGFGLGKADVVPLDREVRWYRWLGPNRVLVGIGVDRDKIEGTAAFDKDGKNWRAVSGLVEDAKAMAPNPATLHANEVLRTFDDDHTVLMLDRRVASGDEVCLFPDVVKIDTLKKIVDRVVNNPGDVVSWLADRNGVVRIGVQRTTEKSTLIYRPDEKSDWRPLSDLIDNFKDSASPLGFSLDGRQVYFTARNEQGFLALYFCDLATGKFSEPLLEAPGYDLEFDYSGIFAGPIWSGKGDAVIGYRYFTAGPKIKWFDLESRENFAAVDAALHDLANLPVSISQDGENILVYSFSDRNPGACYLVRPKQAKVEGLMKACPWINPAQMAEMHPYRYTTRDGVEIEGYLTIPVGQKPWLLPLVVMPHGGPWVRDTWEFDPLVQMLANRGYAVLQMNYRGSAGYGQKFSELGRHEVGGKIQDDIEDAVRWAIDKNVADPKRIAIVGASYGGYSTLFALGKTPGLYTCGISIAGVSDWVSIYTKFDDPEYKFAREHWVKQIGDPAKLKAISPVNFADQIKAPLLIIHGKEDVIVPLKQAKKMVSALERAGNKPEVLFIPEEGHGFKHEKARVQEFKAIEAFLAKHLGQGMAATIPTANVPATQAGVAEKD
jgi:dipeptidyl aminopeptidase/acylaminoacyl peptidase